MRTTPPSTDEGLRLADVHALGLLDTPPEERFDRITRTASRLLHAPVALVTLVDEARTWFKSRQGLSLRETPRSVSFCAHAIASDDPFVVPDTGADDRFAADPLVTGPPFFRAYLGVPLHGIEGYRVGTLCVLDHEPREFQDPDIDALKDLASWAESELGQTLPARTLTIERAGEERLRAILEAVPEGVATFDRKGRILTVNPEGERMYGWAAEDLVGQDLGVLLADDDAGVREALFRRVAGLRRGDPPLRMELTGCRADRSRIPLEVTVGRITVEGGSGYVVAARDLTERRRAEEAVEALRHRQQLILEAAADGICWIDAEGALVFANPSARRMFGLGHGDVAGIHLHHRFHSRRPDGSPYPWEECPTYRSLQTGEAVRVGDEIYFRADGSRVAVEYSAAPVVEEGRVTGVVVTFTDVTERRAVERMKDEFVSVVSHELRTPLTSIRGSLGLLASGALGPLSAEAQRMADIAVSNTDRLVRLVNDILDLERIESGEVALQREPVPVARLLDDAAASVAGMAERCGVQIRLVPVEGLTSVDPDAMVQALSNLLSNAVKYSPPGQEVELAAGFFDDVLELRVTDKGRGIPPAMHARIFDRFQQVDASDARERSGTGLGLAIVKSIATRHGGAVTVQSVPGEGSVFTLTVPTDPGGPEADQEAQPDRERPLVLVVEDDADLAEVLAVTLGRHRIDAIRVENQADAVTEASRLRPDLIVLDVALAEGDGYGVVEELRRDRCLASTPVLVHTVHDLDRHQRRRLLLGPTEFVVKGSARRASVEQKVLRLLGRSVGRDAGRRVLLIDDDPDIQEVAVLALARLGRYSVLVASSGEEGVRTARDERPDVILLDVMMPGVDGPATLTRLRDDPVTAEIPVVFLTAKAQAADRERLARMRVAGILPKPFDPMTLAGEVGRLMGWE